MDSNRLISAPTDLLMPFLLFLPVRRIKVRPGFKG